MPASQEVTTTTEMQAGLATHAKLEAQVSVLVEVAVETPEDVWALKLLNTIQGIHQLLSEGMTRELYIFGELEGIFVRGVIDQLDIQDDGCLLLVEHKTRRHASLPSQAQQRGTALQVMMYCHLLERLGQLLEGSLLELIAERGLSATSELSATLKQHAHRTLVMPISNLPSVLEQLSYAVAALPPCSIAEVRYQWQQDGTELGRELVVYESDILLQHVLSHIRFWKGHIAPSKVRDTDLWKCHRCLFNTHCYDPANRAELNTDTLKGPAQFNKRGVSVSMAMQSCRNE